MQNQFQVVASLEERIRQNPNDAEALWKLYLIYNNGLPGVINRNPQIAEHYYQASYSVAQRQQESLEERRLKAAKDFFEHKKGLEQAIEQHILPAIYLIKNDVFGIIGTGFFQHPTWFVSNAHVIPGAKVLEHTYLLTHQNEALELNVQRAYYRPSHNEKAPDVVILNNTNTPESNPSLPVSYTQDEAYSEHYTFYIEMDLSGGGDHQFRFIQRLLQENTCPLVYKCEDGHIPKPGCSGTPIIEARVVAGREPVWQFRVAGILYARCSPAWYNNNPSGVTQTVSEDTKLVCSIPIDSDFAQLLSTLRNESSASRAQEFAEASKRLGDEQGLNDAHRYQKLADRHSSEAIKGLQAFTQGVTPLNIAIPAGLEKLYYSCIVDISNSLLIRQVLQSIVGRDDRNNLFQKIPEVTLNTLQSDFNNFITQIKNMPNVNLEKGDNAYTSPAGHFRIDIGIGGSKKDYWMLDIQDNTGRRIFIHKKSVSSVFAKIKIPKTESSIKGKQLAEFLLKSQQDKKEIYSDKETDVLQKSTQLGKKK